MSESKGSLWFVYIVEAADGTLYTGVAKGAVSRRINEHLRGEGSRYLLGRGPLRLRYQEQWTGQSAACRREAQIKRWTRKKKLALISCDLALLKRS
ncbi:MAG: GIY-YIG nuclease family protein [Candidatus Omnitrophica bacterium]|nr:GIY-YIG nuclease family protein [Candidatus Omnitrophota bacterium]